MSQETRRKRRLDIRTSRIKKLLLIAFIIGILLLIGMVRDKQSVLKKTIWTKEVNATFYFFKAVSDAEVDGFTAKTITVEPGAKTNGYTVLASQELTVNVAWAERQCLILQSLMDRSAWDDWALLINQTVAAGEDTIVIDTEKITLSDIAPYVGLTQDELTSKYAVMTEFTKGSARSVNLENLDLIRSGAVYTSTTNRRRVMNENFLPYLNTTLLKAIGSTDKSSQNALTVVGNDHIFAVTVLDEKTEVLGEERSLELKSEHMTATGATEKTYYEMLTNREDLVRRYPSLDITVGGQSTEAYLVDSRTEDGKKILVLMIKNNTAHFLKQEKAEGTLEIQYISGYVVSKSAIKTNNEGKTILTLMRDTYFPNEVEVTIYERDGSHYVLKASENENLTEGDLYKVFP